MTAESLMLVGGVSAFALTIHWVRNRDLRERYAIGWLAVATLLLLCGLFPQIVIRMADAAHLTYAAAVLFAALTIIYAFSFFVSVALTHNHRRTVRLLQELAILRNRLETLEARPALAATATEDRGDPSDDADA